MTGNDTENDSPSPEEATEPQRPVLRVVKGDPTPEELVALVAVVSAMGSADAPTARPVPVWAAHHRKMRPTLPHGRDAWRASARPR